MLEALSLKVNKVWESLRNADIFKKLINNMNSRLEESIANWAS